MSVVVKHIANLEGHTDSVYTVIGGPTDKEVFSAAGDGMVVLWDIENPGDGQLIAKVKNSVYAIAYQRKSDTLLVGHNYEGLHFINVAEKKEVATLKLDACSYFDILVQDNLAWVCQENGKVVLVDVDSRTIKATAKHSEARARCVVDLHMGRIAVGYSDNYVRIFEKDTLKLINEWEAHTNSVFGMTSYRDELITVGRDANIRIWDSVAGEALRDSVVAHMYTINDIAMRGDNKYFATCSMDKSIKVWQADEKRLLKVIDKGRHAGHGTSVNKLFWSSCRDRLVSCSDDRKLAVWELEFSE